MSEESVPLKEKILFGISAIPDQMTYQAFGLFVFTFYHDLKLLVIELLHPYPEGV